MDKVLTIPAYVYLVTDEKTDVHSYALLDYQNYCKHVNKQVQIYLVQGREANVANVLAETESMTYLPSAYTLLTQRDPSNQVGALGIWILRKLFHKDF